MDGWEPAAPHTLVQALAEPKAAVPPLLFGVSAGTEGTWQGRGAAGLPGRSTWQEDLDTRTASTTGTAGGGGGRQDTGASVAPSELHCWGRS